MTELCTASYSGNETTVKLLIERGVDVNKRDSTGMTPLTRASIAGKVAIVKLLLAARASVNSPDMVSFVMGKAPVV